VLFKIFHGHFNVITKELQKVTIWLQKHLKKLLKNDNFADLVTILFFLLIFYFRDDRIRSDKKKRNLILQKIPTTPPMKIGGVLGFGD